MHHQIEPVINLSKMHPFKKNPLNFRVKTET
jgi:hypothetical protein